MNADVDSAMLGEALKGLAQERWAKEQLIFCHEHSMHMYSTHMFSLFLTSMKRHPGWPRAIAIPSRKQKEGLDDQAKVKPRPLVSFTRLERDRVHLASTLHRMDCLNKVVAVGTSSMPWNMPPNWKTRPLSAAAQCTSRPRLQGYTALLGFSVRC